MSTSTSPLKGRVRSIDWMRGACVLLMIHAHALVLLKPTLRTGALYRWVDWVDGLVSPGFILASGFSIALIQLRAIDAEEKTQRARRSVRRIGQVLGTACAVNGMWFSFLDEPWRLLRMDILHAIAAGLFLALGLCRALAERPSWLGPLAIAAGLSIFVASPMFAQLPAPWAHLLNKKTDSLFPLVPWTGYALLGVPLGLSATTGGLRGLRRALWLLAGIGVGLWALAPWLNFYPPHDYYEAHPSYHGLRLASVCAAVSVVVFWEERRGAQKVPVLLRGLEQVSAVALPVYFFHLVLLHYPFGGASLSQRWGARSGWLSYALLTLALCAASFGFARLYRTVVARGSPLGRLSWPGLPRMTP